jgi:hypothetical protein
MQKETNGQLNSVYCRINCKKKYIANSSKATDDEAWIELQQKKHFSTISFYIHVGYL